MALDRSAAECVVGVVVVGGGRGCREGKHVRTSRDIGSGVGPITILRADNRGVGVVLLWGCAGSMASAEYHVCFVIFYPFLYRG